MKFCLRLLATGVICWVVVPVVGGGLWVEFIGGSPGGYLVAVSVLLGWPASMIAWYQLDAEKEGKGRPET